jgi:probable HAF family extracellular repeat protein
MQRFTAVSIGLAIAILCRTAQALSPYQITDLGTLGGSTSLAFGLNIHGDVVGSSITASGAEHAFLYHNGAMSDLGVLNSGDTFSRATAINDSGTVVGQSIGATSSPFYYSNGQMRFVGSLGGNYGSANRINSAGQIVGISADSNGVTHAFRSTGGTMADLGAFPTGSNYSIAYGINSSGNVTGYSTTDASGDYDAFFYTSGSPQDIGNLGGNSRGFAINDAGYIAGDSIVDGNGDQRVFLWHNGIFTDLGATAGAVSVDGGNLNNFNQVVGTLIFDLSDGTKNHGFLYSDGVMVDVNTLLPANSGWTLRDAQAINDLGQIVGFGKISGEQHAYLLSPVPEPSGIVLALGAIPFAFIARRACRSYTPSYVRVRRSNAGMRPVHSTLMTIIGAGFFISTGCVPHVSDPPPAKPDPAVQAIGYARQIVSDPSNWKSNTVSLTDLGAAAQDLGIADTPEFTEFDSAAQQLIQFGTTWMSTVDEGAVTRLRNELSHITSRTEASVSGQVAVGPDSPLSEGGMHATVDSKQDSKRLQADAERAIFTSIDGLRAAQAEEFGRIFARAQTAFRALRSRLHSMQLKQ